MHTERLLKLTTHLEMGKLGHKKFDFAVYNEHNNGIDCLLNPGKCGTSGCAIGECPIVFPEDWEFERETGQPLLKNSIGLIITDAEYFFELTHKQACHLFVANQQHPDLYGGIHLTEYATRYEVAKQIRDFIESRGKNA